MNLFYIQPDKGSWGKLYSDNIDATHIWNMPGIKCDVCGQTWAIIGISYPKIDLSTLSFVKELSEPWPVDVETFNKLHGLVIPFVPDSLPFPPGTEFGPLVGDVKGKLGDVAWNNLWTPLIKRDAYSALTSFGLKLPEGQVPNLSFEEKGEPDLFELQIEPRALLSPFSYSSLEPKLCSNCGRDSRKVKQVIVDIESIPSELDMFRIVDFPTKILVTERFRDAINKAGLTNIQFSSVEVL